MSVLLFLLLLLLLLLLYLIAKPGFLLTKFAIMAGGPIQKL